MDGKAKDEITMVNEKYEEQKYSYLLTWKCEGSAASASIALQVSFMTLLATLAIFN